MTTSVEHRVTVRPGVAVWIDRQAREVSFLTEEPFAWENVPLEELEAIEHMNRGVAVSELTRLLGSERASALVARLTTKRVLRRGYENDFRGSAFERQVDFFSEAHDDPSAAQRALARARVLIVGCGGIGQIVLQHLVAAGVGGFTLVDPDRVEITNLNRQFASCMSDLGREKVVVAKRYVLERNREASVQTHVGAVLAAQDLKAIAGDGAPDLIVCAADTPPMRVQLAVAEYCERNDTACTFGGVGIRTGYFGPLLTNSTGRRAFIEALTAWQADFAGASTRVLGASFGPPNTMIAAYMALDCVRWLSGIGAPMSRNRQLSLSFEDGALSLLRDWEATAPDQRAK